MEQMFLKMQMQISMYDVDAFKDAIANANVNVLCKYS